MSSTSVNIVFKTRARWITDLHNGHGSGQAIWDYINTKINGEPLPMLGNVENFWPLWKSDCLSREEKAVLLSSYDWAVVEKDHLLEFSEACKKVHPMIIDTTNWTWSHWGSIGIVAKAKSEKIDHRAIGLGVGCTSVCDEWEQFEQGNSWGVYAEIDSLT